MTWSGHPRVASLIDELHLVAHPEGGYYHRSFDPRRWSRPLTAAGRVPA